MMMKKLLYTLLAFTFALASCSEQIDVPETVPADCIMLKVFNSPMTKAVTDRSGEEYEKTLKRLDCFFYVKGQTDRPCVYYQKVDVDKVTTAEIPFYVDESVINTIFPGGNTTCDVFVIANLPSGTFAAGMAGTDVATLNKIQLQLGQGYDAINQNFLMAGLDVATKGNNNNATGTIPLYRAAAKITVSVSIPAEITVEYEKADDVRMTPVLKDDTGAVTLKTAFHNGVTKTYLRDDYTDNIVDEDFFYTDKKSYTYVSTTAATADAPEKYLYTCEIPFYSYAREWDKGADNPVYLTLDLPWKNETTGQHQTYYYQILVNAAGRELRPNAWYDLTVNVGVLGSKVEAEPVLLKNTTYYVLDWTTEPDPEHEAGGDRYEDVDIQKYTYLVVPETRIEINNASVGQIRYDASHKLGIKMNTTLKPVETLEGTETEFGAYYVYCGPQLNANGQVVMDNGKPKIIPPAPKEISITASNFDDNNQGVITYNYEIPTSVYSPVYSYITVWLDFNGNKILDDDEKEFQEDVMVIQYPAIYVTPDQTTEYSIYVNEVTDTETNRNNSVRFQHNNQYYGLGVVPGTNNTTGSTAFMYTITVSSLKESDVFYFSTTNDSDDEETEYKYIIGDPRSRISDTILNDDGFNTNNSWATAPSIDGTERKLQYYYPTSSEPGAFQIIAPKFRVVSFHGNGHQYHNIEGAIMRCASYQEDGYPAGRWRLPTFAELQFIVKLQEANVICPIFYGNSKYFTPTTQVTYNANGSTYGRYDFTSPNNDGGSGSVRCVYDEWYWGAQKDAQKNTAANPSAGKEYVFTWGDKQIW